MINVKGRNGENLESFYHYKNMDSYDTAIKCFCNVNDIFELESINEYAKFACINTEIR